MSIHKILPLPQEVLDHHYKTLSNPTSEWLAQKRMPPVLLITGISGVGKRSIVYHLAQWLLCQQCGWHEQPESDNLFGDLLGAPAAAEKTKHNIHPCGECSSCKKMFNGACVDFHEVIPKDKDEDTDKDSSLKIDQFREIKSFLGFGAHEEHFKIILIPNAERMTQQAANSVLKMLEEPPKGWLFFLTANDASLLLPTIRSRCQAVSLKPLPKGILLSLLENAGVEQLKAAVCAELAQGSWGKAFKLAENEAWSKRRIIFNFLSNPEQNIAPLIEWASQGHSNFALLVDQLEHITHDMIRWGITADTIKPEIHDWANTDGVDAILTHIKKFDPSRPESHSKAIAFWIERSERLARSRKEMLLPLNRKLLVQDLLLPWLAAGNMDG
ncbi:MAG: DNA polymerase III subunit [Bdellovibrionota bacterium]